MAYSNVTVASSIRSAKLQYLSTCVRVGAAVGGVDGAGVAGETVGEPAVSVGPDVGITVGVGVTGAFVVKLALNSVGLCEGKLVGVGDGAVVDGVCVGAGVIFLYPNTP
jgi:hypothetical protein